MSQGGRSDHLQIGAAVRLFLGIGASAILLTVILITELELRQTGDPNVLPVEPQFTQAPTKQKQVLPIAEKSSVTSSAAPHKKVAPVAKQPSSVSFRAPIKLRPSSVPSGKQPLKARKSASVAPIARQETKDTIKFVVRPPAKLASLPPARSKKKILQDAPGHVESPKPKRKSSYTVSERIGQYGEKARKRLKPHFTAAGVRYPAKEIILVGLKRERRLQLYAGKSRNNLKFIRDFPILAASGRAGPKLEQGDEQVPEGLYNITALNPNSKFHLSLRVNYPNRFDVKMGRKDGRAKLGGDIMIHGNCVNPQSFGVESKARVCHCEEPCDEAI
jgi:hypothetical protein